MTSVGKIPRVDSGCILLDFDILVNTKVTVHALDKYDLICALGEERLQSLIPIAGVFEVVRSMFQLLIRTPLHAFAKNKEHSLRTTKCDIVDGPSSPTGSPCHHQRICHRDPFPRHLPSTQTARATHPIPEIISLEWKTAEFHL